MTVIIAYNTITGNTEICAEWIRDALVEQGHDVDVHDTSDIYSSMLENYDMIVLGSPTYGYGETTAQFEPFLDEMVEMDLRGKRAAVFGLGDSEIYPDEFCAAVDELEESLTQVGAVLVSESLRIDGNPVDYEDEIRKWASNLADAEYA